ncbi:NUDIX domain-containing protein [uncultured Clostridium sp.]|uniref:NAD(+) diphosphatase n=1 Tax=uncultured Clostridium sp. TaxID=59620 RepID=UPI00262076B1|nr:NUDIX domain-containing protein [uncultured Clostridium sp.]
MKFKYCPLCGRELEEKYSWDEGGVPYCAHDDKMFFDTPKPCVVVGVIKDNKILLLKQSYIFKNSKVLISGYVGQNENVEETVYREVLEEAGIEIKDIEYLGSDYVKDCDLLMLTFIAFYDKGEIKKSEEVEGIEWCDIDCALAQMTEDLIGTKAVKKIMKLVKR